MKSLSHRLSLDKVREKIRSLSSRFLCHVLAGRAEKLNGHFVMPPIHQS